MSFFFGYTEGLFPILSTTSSELTIGFHANDSIEVISINGVCTRVVKKEQSRITVRKVAEVALDSLRFVSVGMPSFDKDLYLLDGVAHGLAILQKREKAIGHKYTLRMVFEVNKHLYGEMADLKYIGLNGSSFFFQERIEDKGRFFFSVHVGRMTREKTIFNESSCEIWEECIVSFPPP